MVTNWSICKQAKAVFPFSRLSEEKYFSYLTSVFGKNEKHHFKRTPRALRSSIKHACVVGRSRTSGCHEDFFAKIFEKYKTSSILNFISEENPNVRSIIISYEHCN